MQTTRTIKRAVLIVGVLLLAVSLSADVTGIGNDPGFGRQQIAGTILGVILTIAGFLLKEKVPSELKNPGEVKSGKRI